MKAASYNQLVLIENDRFQPLSIDMISFEKNIKYIATCRTMGAQWLSGGVLDSRPKGRGFEPHRRHCVMSLSKNINPSLVLVQPRKTRPYITERLLMGRKESNQTNKKCRTISSTTRIMHE